MSWMSRLLCSLTMFSVLIRAVGLVFSMYHTVRRHHCLAEFPGL